jgi:hypothetical protein
LSHNQAPRWIGRRRGYMLFCSFSPLPASRWGLQSVVRYACIMRYLWMTLLVLSPAILYGVALLATALSMRFYRGRCPTCRRRGLKPVDFCLATVLVNGKRAPDHWADYECEQCGSLVRWHHSAWEAIPDSATRQHA